MELVSNITLDTSFIEMNNFLPGVKNGQIGSTILPRDVYTRFRKEQQAIEK